MQSGSDRSEWAIIKSNNDAKHYAQELARELGCPTGDMFRLTKCLTEHRSFGEIVNASSKVRLRVSITHSSRLLIWTYPCIDKIMKIKSLWMFKVMKMKLNSIIQNDYLYFSTKQDCFVCVCVRYSIRNTISQYMYMSLFWGKKITCSYSLLSVICYCNFHKIIKFLL